MRKNSQKKKKKKKKKPNSSLSSSPSYPSCHRVEEKLRRTQPLVEARRHKPLCGGRPVPSRERRQGPPAKAVGGPRAADRLLPDAADHLGDVDRRPFRAALRHQQGGVVPPQARHAEAGDALSDAVEGRGGGGLEGGAGVAGGGGLWGLVC